MHELVRFRLFAVRISLLLTVVLGSIAWAAFGRPPGLGLILGGLGGTLIFWFQARAVEKLALRSGAGVSSVPTAWHVIRLVVYALVLTRAYYLDPEGFTGLIGAVIGLFVIVATVVLLGVTGLDTPPSDEGQD